MRVSTISAVGFFATFEEVKNFFEAADLQSFGVTGSGQSRLHQFFSGFAWFAEQVPQDDAVAVFGDEVPIESFGISEAVVQFVSLFRGQQFGESSGGGGHGDTGSV